MRATPALRSLAPSRQHSASCPRQIYAATDVSDTLTNVLNMLAIGVILLGAMAIVGAGAYFRTFDTNLAS
ncbi:MAG: hypothetical protein Q4A01_08395 [Coriobacteriales bacterium]|nr:hypothetical protein [Coriobacteriales bacterium]